MSAAPSHGIIAFSDGGRSPATSHCVIAKYDTPLVPTRPLLHGCLPAHSIFTLCSLTTCDHVRASARTSSVNACDEADKETVIICLESASFISGLESAATTAAWSLSRIGLGVAAGANSACQALVPMPGK